MIFNKKADGYIFSTKGRDVNTNRTSVYDYFLPILTMTAKQVSGEGAIDLTVKNSSGRDIIVYFLDADGLVYYSETVKPSTYENESTHIFTTYDIENMTITHVAFASLNNVGNYYIWLKDGSGIPYPQPCIEDGVEVVYAQDGDDNIIRVKDYCYSYSYRDFKENVDENDLYAIKNGSSIELTDTVPDEMDIVYFTLVNNCSQNIEVITHEGNNSTSYIIPKGSREDFKNMSRSGGTLEFRGGINGGYIYTYYFPYGNPDAPRMRKPFELNNENDVFYHDLRNFLPLIDGEIELRDN